MSQTPTDQLQLAYELIQSNALKEARKLLSDYLDDSPRDIDAWWLLVHATEDPSEAERALRQILRLDPSHENARQLLGELETLQVGAASSLKGPSFLDRLDEDEAEVPAATSSGIKRLGESKSASLDDDDFGDFDDDFDDRPEAPRAERSSRRLLTAVLGILALVLVVAALLVLGTQRGSTPEATSVAGQATATTGAVIDVTNAPTQEISMGDEALLALFAPAVTTVTTPADRQFEIVDTPQGRTVTMLVCSAPSNRAIRTATFSGMTAMANASMGAEGGVQNVGVQVINCDAGNAPLRFITVDLASAQRFASGELNESQFASLWETQ